MKNKADFLTDKNGNLGLRIPTSFRALVMTSAKVCSKNPSFGSSRWLVKCIII